MKAVENICRLVMTSEATWFDEETLESSQTTGGPTVWQWEEMLD
jgi:hypothetical protein